MAEKCIFPISPRDVGRLFIVTYGYEGVMTTDSTLEAAVNTSYSHFSRLSPDQLAEMELHSSLVNRSDFICGVVEMTQLLGTRDTEVAYYEAFDANPHFEDDQICELEAQFKL